MRDPIEDDAFRREVCDWLRANGIDPHRTPMNPDPSIADGRITIRQKVQRDGRDVILDGFDVLKETITVPLLVEPEGDIAEWLRPRCSECGR